jgi:hypothetical protein
MQPERNNSARLNKHTLIAVAGFVIIVVLGTFLAGTPLVHAQLENLKLLPQPEHYTELYFNDPSALPSTVPLASIAFSFTIHNVTGQAMVYPYTVSLVTSPTTTEVISSGSEQVNAGQTVAVPAVVSVSKTVKSGEVVVTLVNQKQSIDFWLGNTQ